MGNDLKKEKVDDKGTVTKSDEDKGTVTKSNEDKNSLPNYGLEKEEEMKKKKDDFKDMDFFSAVCDSKIPEEDKTIINFMSFKATKSGDITGEIQLYETFYKEVKELLNETSKENQTAEDQINLRKKISKFKQKMSTQLHTSKTKEKTTSSSAVYRLHQSFIEDYNKLECVVLDSENEALHKELVEMESRWKNALETIDNLKGDLKDINAKYDSINTKFEDLKKDYKTSTDLQKQMKEDNEKMKEQLNEILRCLKKPPPP